MLDKQKLMMGWYSEKQRQQCRGSINMDCNGRRIRQAGSIVYRTPDGGEVEVTEITEPDKPPSPWDDMKCVGHIVEYAVVREIP